MADRPAPVAEANGSEPAPADRRQAVAALILAHHAAVYRYACRLCGCPTEAEDLTQQAFLIALQKQEQIREPDRACAWLLAVTRTCFLKSVRKVRPVAMADLDLAVADSTSSPHDLAEIDQEQLQAALAELPDDFRLVLVMFYFEELSYQEIAQALDIPAGTVMSRLSRAKGHLRQRLLAASGGSAQAARTAPRGSGESSNRPLALRIAD